MKTTISRGLLHRLTCWRFSLTVTWLSLCGMAAPSAFSWHTSPMRQDDSSAAAEPVNPTAPSLSAIQDTNAAIDDPLPAIPGWLVERSIYIPYEKLRATFEKQQRGVFVPYEEFDRLWELARKAMQPETVAEAPRSGLIVESQSTAQASRTTILISSELQIEFLRTGWHEVPLALSDAALQEAVLDGEPARIVRGPDQQNMLLVHVEQAPSRKTLTLQYAKAVSASGGEYQVSLLIPTAAINRWQVRVDESDVNISVAPAAVITSQPTEIGAQPDSSSITAIIGSVPEITFRWTPRAVGAERMEAIVTAESTSAFSVQKNLVRLNQRIQLNIQRAAISQLQLRIPTGFEVVAVNADYVRRWEKDAADPQLLLLDFFEEIRGDRALEVDLEMNLPMSESVELTLASVEILGAVRQPGTVTIQADPGLGLEIASLMGLLRTHSATANDTSAPRFTFRHSNVPFLLRLTLTELEPLVRAIESIEARLDTAAVVSEVIFLLDIQRAGVFAIPFELPEGVELLQVSGFAYGDYQPVVIDSSAVPSKEGASHIVALARQAIGKIGIRMSLRQPITVPRQAEENQASEVTVRWPHLSSGFAEYLTGQVRLALPESLSVTAIEQGSLRSIDAATFAAYSGESVAAAALAYEFVMDVPDLKLAVTPRRPQIMTDLLTHVFVEPGLVRHHGELFVDVKYSPIDALRIDVPEGMAPRLRLESPGWQSSAMAPQPADVKTGYQAWSFQAGKELLGAHTIRVTWDEPLDEIAVGESQRIPVASLAPYGTDRSRGQIVVHRSELFDLQIDDAASGLRPIDPTLELFGGRRSDDAVAALEYVGEWQLRLRAARLELHDLKRTSIRRSLVRAVWLRQGQLSVQAIYQINGVNQRLHIHMPPGFEASSGFDQNPVRVDGQSVPVERGAGNELIISMVNRDRDQTLLVELRYTMPVSNSSIMVPTFADDCAVQKTMLCVYVPREWAPLAAGGPWTDTYGEERESIWSRVFRVREQNENGLLTWINTSAVPVESLSSFETDGRVYVFSTLQPQAGEMGALHLPTVRRDVMLIALLGSLFIAGMLLVRSSWTARFVFVCSAIAAGMLVLILVPIATEMLPLQLLQATAIAVLGIWVVSSVAAGGIQWWRRRPPRNARATAAPQTPQPDAAATANTPAESAPASDASLSKPNEGSDESQA